MFVIIVSTFVINHCMLKTITLSINLATIPSIKHHRISRVLFFCISLAHKRIKTKSPPTNEHSPNMNCLQLHFNSETICKLIHCSLYAFSRKHTIRNPQLYLTFLMSSFFRIRCSFYEKCNWIFHALNVGNKQILNRVIALFLCCISLCLAIISKIYTKREIDKLDHK